MTPTSLPRNVSRPLRRRPPIAALAALLVSTLAGTASPAAAQAEFDLMSAIPEDVFIVTASLPNAERQFLDDYWGEVWGAFEASGLMDEAMDLLIQNVGEEEREQIAYFEQRLGELCGMVEWKSFCQGEVVFAERLMEPLVHGDRNFVSGPPDMVLLVRTDEEVARKNFDGLSAILEGIVGEVAKLTGADLRVDRSEDAGTEFVVFDPFQAVPDAPAFDLAIGRRGDVLMLTVGQTIRSQVAGLLSGEGEAKPLAKNPRFQAALQSLPAPEDGFEYSDLQNLAGGMEKFLGAMLSVAGAKRGDYGPGDVIINAREDDEANALTRKSYDAYQKGNYAEALRLSQAAHLIDSTDSVVMYNLACFHALVGESEKAMEWLGSAVAGGFYAPEKISEDSDLDSLRDDPRFGEILVRARELAGGKVEPQMEEANGELAIAQVLVGTLLDTLGMFDYSLTVRRTDGYSMYADSITLLEDGAEKNPFYAVLNTPSMESFARYLPKETTAFDVNGGFDFEALYSFLENTVAKTGEKGMAVLEMWAAWQVENDFDIRADALSLLGTGLVSVEFELGGKDASVFMVAVRGDEVVADYLSQGIAELPGLIAEAAKQNPMMGMLGLTVTPTSGLEGFQDIGIGMAQEKVVCGVAGGWLYFASSADAIRTVQATAAGEHPNVLENEALMSKAIVPDGPAQAVAFKDLSGTGEELATVLRMVSMFGPMSVTAIPDPEARRIIGKVFVLAGRLAPVLQRIDFYDSSAYSQTFDGKAWHKRTVTHYVEPVSDEPASESGQRVGAVTRD